MMKASKQSPAALAVAVVLSASMVLPLLFHASSIVQVRLLSAVVPVLIILHLFIRSDRFPEPPHLILVTFLLGILVTVPVVSVVAIVDRLLGGFAVWGPFASPVLTAFVAAAIPEETGKFLILTRYCARRSAFDEPMDGLVYGVTASLGFAALENVLYVFKEPAYPQWVDIASLRAFSAVPSHAVDGAVMGFFIGLRHAIPARHKQLTWAGWVVPVALHGLYDLGAFLGVPILWFWVFLFQLGMARSMLVKLRAIQDGREHPEAVVQWAWAAARRRLRLKPRALALPTVVERHPDAAGAGAEADPRAASDSFPADVPATCPHCNRARAACICPPSGTDTRRGRGAS